MGAREGDLEGRHHQRHDQNEPEEGGDHKENTVQWVLGRSLGGGGRNSYMHRRRDMMQDDPRRVWVQGIARCGVIARLG